MAPYVIGVLPRYVEIRTIIHRVVIQSIELLKPRYITKGKHIYVASTSHVWRLIPVSLPMQIQQLLQEKQFSLSLILAVSNCYKVNPFTPDSDHSKIDKFSKIANWLKLENNWHCSKILLNSFPTNEYTLGLCP